MPDESLPFDYALNMGEIEIFGERPFKTDVRVFGAVSKAAGTPIVDAVFSFDYFSVCARCAEDTIKRYDIEISRALTPPDKQSDDIEAAVYQDDIIDVDEVAVTEIMLAVRPFVLCADDCAGLCPVCGVNLNNVSCGHEK